MRLAASSARKRGGYRPKSKRLSMTKSSRNLKSSAMKDGDSSDEDRISFGKISKTLSTKRNRSPRKKSRSSKRMSRSKQSQQRKTMAMPKKTLPLFKNNEKQFSTREPMHDGPKLEEMKPSSQSSSSSIRIKNDDEKNMISDQKISIDVSLNQNPTTETSRGI